MLRSIINSSIRFRTLVLAAAAVLLIVGVSQVQKAPLDVLPEFTQPVVRVQTESLGLSANEVEELITVPMEQDLLNGVKGADTIRSDSVPGLSSIDLTFARGTPVLQARQLVQERLTQAHALPNVSRPPQMLEPVSSTGHVMIVGLSSRRVSPIELSVLARWTIRPRLMGLAGVANVAIWGQRERQLQVLVDPQRLRRHHLSVAQVVSTAGNAQLVSPLSFLEASTPGTGGFLDGPIQRLSVRHVLPFGAPRDLAQVPIEGTPGGTHVRLGDVATVQEGHQPLIGDAVVRGGPGLLMVIDKLPGANTLEVTRALDRALDGLRPGMPGVSVDRSIFRPATFIDSAIDHLTLMLLLAAGLVVLALIAFLRRWHAVLVGAVAIPLSMLAALLVLYLTGETINALVVAGLVIALGVVIDDALGDSESIARRIADRRRDDGDDASLARIALDASLEMRSPLAYATLIVLLAAAPVLIANGVTASFVHPMALAFALAVAASMVVALTVTPVLSVLLTSRSASRPGSSVLVQRAGELYGRLLARTVRRPAVVVLACCALGVAGLAFLPGLMEPHAPAFKERDLLVRLNAAPGLSLTEMNRVTSGTVRDLRALPGIRTVGANIGRAVTGDQAVGTNSGEIWVSMDSGADYDRTLASVRDVVDRIPGLTASVKTYESEKSAGVLKSPDDTVAVRVYGEDYGVLHAQATRLARSLSGIAGVRDPRVELADQQPTVQIEVNLASALKRGIKPGDVRRAAATLLSGITVGDFFERQKVFEVVVRGVASTHASITTVRNLVIDKPGGGHLRLGDVADVRIAPAPVDIRHDAVSRYVDVRMHTSGRDVGSVRRDVQREVSRSQFPLEYTAELLSAPAGSHTSRGDFTIFVTLAAIGIFLLLQAAFGSWRLASLLFLILPSALLGGVVVAFATGNEHSIGAAAGLMAVFAVAVRQGILLVRHLQRREDCDGAVEPAQVVPAMRERLVPTLMTSATVAVAMLPFALFGDTAGNEITHPAALVILGGLVTSTALSLFVVPAVQGFAGTLSRWTAARRARAVH